MSRVACRLGLKFKGNTNEKEEISCCIVLEKIQVVRLSALSGLYNHATGDSSQIVRALEIRHISLILRSFLIQCERRGEPHHSLRGFKFDTA
jgi:hypothetical protein